MSDPAAPATTCPARPGPRRAPMVSTSIRLPAAALDRAEALAGPLALDRSDVLRLAILRGLPALEKEQVK